MKLVVKLGGKALEEAGLLSRCAQVLAALARRGHRVAVVHGGGSALTRTLEQLGKTSEFVNGLRVTDAETREVALMVLAGGINKRLVAVLARAGQPAMGLTGGDGLAFRARKLPANGRDLGFVGEVCASDPRWLEVIWAQGALPVVASLALGMDGEYYNINADQMAAACAVTCEAEALIFLTDVPGVWDASRRRIERLRAAEIPGLAEREIIQGGMLPKLEACRQALAGGVERVHILPAAEVESLPRVMAAEAHLGTEVVV